MQTNKPSQRTKELETLSVLALFFLILSIFKPQKSLLLIAAAFLIISLFIKPLARIISKIWLKFAVLVGEVSNRIILTAVFCLFLLPLSWLRKFSSKDNLHLKIPKDNNSLWIDRSHLYTNNDLENVW